MRKVSVMCDLVREISWLSSFVGRTSGMFSSIMDHNSSFFIFTVNVRKTNSEESLRKLSTLLTHATPPVPHHMWIEQPENVPTCIALAPNHRDSRIKKALDKSGSRLWKGWPPNTLSYWRTRTRSCLVPCRDLGYIASLALCQWKITVLVLLQYVAITR